VQSDIVGVHVQVPARSPAFHRSTALVSAASDECRRGRGHRRLLDEDLGL